MSDTTDQPNELIAFTAWLENLRTDVSETVGGVLLRGARSVPVGSGGTVRPTSSAGALVGFALRNTGAVAASVVLRDGTNADAAAVVPLNLAPGESVRDWFGPGGINLTNGLFVDVTAGAVDGSVFIGGVS